MDENKIRPYFRNSNSELISIGESLIRQKNKRQLIYLKEEISFRKKANSIKKLQIIREKINICLETLSYEEKSKKSLLDKLSEESDSIQSRKADEMKFRSSFQSNLRTKREDKPISDFKNISKPIKEKTNDEKINPTEEFKETKPSEYSEIEDDVNDLDKPKVKSREIIIPAGFSSIKDYLVYKLKNNTSQNEDQKENNDDSLSKNYTDQEKNVFEKIKSWADELVDLSGRNDLISFRQTKTTSYIPSDEIVESLLNGDSVSVSDLEDLEAEGNIKGSVKEAIDNYEQYGIEVFSLISGFAIWKSEMVSNAYSPLLYYKLSIDNPKEKRIKNITFSIKNMEPEVNPALVLHLNRRMGEEISDDLLKLAQLEGEEMVRGYLLEEISKDLEFEIEEGYAMKNLRYLKFPMVKDILSAGDALMNNLLITALAGDRNSMRKLRDDIKDVDINEPDYIPPANEFLVLDADSSQEFAINSALKGQNLVIEGPPGTGKSQTITNLISSLIAQGKSVLFVAEKRAAIDAVKKRINKVGLEDYFLDLHSIDTFIKRPAESFRQQLESILSYRKRRVQENNNLTRSRDILVSRSKAMKSKKNIWNSSYLDVLNLAIKAKKNNDFAHDITDQEIDNLNPESLKKLETLLAELSRLSLDIFVDESFPMRLSFLESKIRTPSHIQKIYISIDNIKKNILEIYKWRQFQNETNESNTDSLEKIYKIENSVSEVLSNQILDLSKDFILEKEKINYLRNIFRKNFIFRWYFFLRDKSYRDLLSIFKKIIFKEKEKNYENIFNGLRILDIKKNLESEKIKIINSSNNIFEVINLLKENLSQLNNFLDKELNQNSSIEKIRKTNEILQKNRELIPNLIKINELLNELLDLGLSQDNLFENILKDFQNGFSHSRIFQRVTLGWCDSVEELMRIESPSLSIFNRDYLDDIVDEFRKDDSEHIEKSFVRISTILDNNAFDSLNNNPSETQILRQELARSRKFKPARELFEKVSNVAKKLKPCWAMSPLVVSKVMPSSEPFFDVVIFDEASQIVPYDAITSILRGKQTIVAGDSKQLSPTSTAFFATGNDANAVANSVDDDDDGFSAVDETESLLDAVKEALPPVYGTKKLLWHYRSEDERLISFSNCHPELYQKKLITAPSVSSNPPFIYHQVEGDFNEISGKSPEAECRKTIELSINHLKTKPNESLAVIAFGAEHARRLEKEYRKQTGDEDFSISPEDRPEEKFIIRHLETIQGDERDVIFLSTGYGPNSADKLRQNFGPINLDNPKFFGLRRLNVAITRARKRIEIISTIDPYKYDDNQLNQVSKKAFIQYLRYVKSGGTDLGDLSIESVPMNAFEQDIYDALIDRGIGLVPQYGVSGYRLDFAVQHPKEKGKYILAIEADGATYHSSDTARDRDRIRQSHLERLGWKFHRIWSREWFKNKEQEIEIALIAIKQALDEYNL